MVKLFCVLLLLAALSADVNPANTCKVQLLTSLIMQQHAAVPMQEPILAIVGPANTATITRCLVETTDDVPEQPLWQQLPRATDPVWWRDWDQVALTS